MNDTDRYIPDAIEVRAWPGFHTAAEVDGMIGDILEEDATESLVRAAVRPEFEKKRAAEAARCWRAGTWMPTTRERRKSGRR